MPQMQLEPTRTETETAQAYVAQQRSQQYRPTLETEHERREAERREARRLRDQQVEQDKRLKAEQEIAAREHERQIAAHHAYIHDQWSLFQKIQHDAPPTLLPLERKQELKQFQEFLEKQTVRKLEPSAIDRFKSEINLQANDGERAVRSIEDQLRSPSFLSNLRRLIGYGKLIDLLRKCVVSISVPELGSPAKEAVASARKFLRRAWSSHLEQGKQSLFSVHRCAGKTIIHLGSSVYGSVFITLPQSLAPEAIAEAFLSEIKRVTSNFIPQDGTLAVVDGDHQSVNYQRLFQSSIVVRSVSDDCEKLAKNLNEMLEREPVDANNTALHLGLPANKDELNSVFKGGGADWDMWSEVAPLWMERANRHGFDRTANASSHQILESLTTSKNVIIVVAHGDDRTIYLPAPPPKGSELSADEVIARKEEISANKPVVYLFCCETAEISNLKSFSQVLLECGAAAVISPQTKIDAELSVNFFENIISDKKEQNVSYLKNIKTAQSRSNYREMEIWLG